MSLRNRALAITAAYAVVATIWIYASDHALEALAPDPHTLLAWSVYKGVWFVALTSVLLFVLMRKVFGSIELGYWKVKAHEAEIERVNRWLAALSQVNHAIAWETSRDALLPRVCAALVEQGGARSAWIALRGSDGALSCAAAFPEGSETFDAELAGAALASDSGLVRNRLQGAPPGAPWEERAASLGARSLAACAIRRDGQLCGCIVVMSDAEDEFQGKELALIEEAATDLSLALDHIRNVDARVDAQLRAEHEQSFSAAMIESLPGVAYFYDDQGRFLRWNSNFSRVTGYSNEEIAAMHPLQFFGSADRDRVAARIAEVFESGESAVEAALLTKDGRSIPYLFTGKQVMFEGAPTLVGMGIDIAAREEAVRALRELNDTLEARVAQRTAELSAALIRAESADRLKSAFLATMSHELRTPLNSIIGFTGILLKGMAGPLSPEQEKQLGMVRVSARHLLELINDVLDLSKIEAGQLQIRNERFAVRDCVDRVLGIVQPLARAKNLHLACDFPEAFDIRGDRRRLEQILLNLLNNAVKFTDRGSVRLEVVAPDAQGHVLFRVRDTGIGIRSDDLPLLFRPFQQVDDGLARQHEGTGLGLAICRRLCELMGGSIAVESRFEMGSTFVLKLPAEAP